MYWSLGDIFHLQKYIYSFSVIVKSAYISLCVCEREHEVIDQKRLNNVLQDWILSSKWVKIHIKSQTFTVFMYSEAPFLALL